VKSYRRNGDVGQVDRGDAVAGSGRFPGGGRIGGHVAGAACGAGPVGEGEGSWLGNKGGRCRPWNCRRFGADYDAWGTPEEEAKRAELNEWLEANDQTRAPYFEWVPVHLAERKRLARMRRLLAKLETERKGE
jgi:hypothetical protein